MPPPPELPPPPLDDPLVDGGDAGAAGNTGCAGASCGADAIDGAACEETWGALDVCGLLDGSVVEVACAGEEAAAVEIG